MTHLAILASKASVFLLMDYQKFSTRVGQEEGIKIKIKLSKHAIGENFLKMKIGHLYQKRKKKIKMIMTFYKK